MRTSPYLDVISQNAQYTTEELEHARKDNIAGFERGTVNLKIGNNNYSADVDIGVKNNGKKMFYDLSNIKKIEAASSEPEQNSRTSEQLEVTSNNKITQDDNIVKNETTKPQTVEEAIAQPNEETKNPITEQEVEEAAEILGESEEKILEEKVPQKEITEWEKQKIKDYLKGGFPQGANKNLDAIERHSY